jgi:hypothetical protein
LLAGAALQAPTGAQQRALDLSALTVPAGKLPSGCALAPLTRPAVDGRVQVVSSFPVPIPTNPWHGTDRPILAGIRQRRTGLTPMPDGPPPAARDARRMFLHLADGISDGYAAFYRSADDQGLTAVYALRFDDPSDAQAWAGTEGRGDVAALLGGTAVVVVQAGPSRCFASVREYVSGSARQ